MESAGTKMWSSGPCRRRSVSVRPVRLYTVLILVSVCVGAGCGSEDEREASGAAGDVDGAAAGQVAGSRRYPQVSWDTVYRIGGHLQDTLLLRPRQIAADDTSLYVYDYHDARLKAFDREGNLRWTFGGRGGGPGEFRNALDLKVGPDGGAWIVDGNNGRITHVSSAGNLQRIIPFGGERIKDVIPLSTEILATTVSPSHFWISFGARDEITEWGPFPLPGLQEVDPLRRQTISAVSPDGNAWAAVFPFGDRFVVFDGKQPRCSGQLIEGEPFPPPNREPEVWAVRVALGDSTLWVLAKGRTEDALRIVDEYALRDCTYRRTLRLPHKVLAITYSDGVFYLQHEDPAPTLLAVRPVFTGS